MVEIRFDLLTVKSYNKVIGRCRELINASKFDEIEKEFGYPTNEIWDKSGNFLNPDSDTSETLDVLYFSNDYNSKDAYLCLKGDVEGKNGATLFYFIRGVIRYTYSVGVYTSVEELVKQINIELEALKYYDDLFCTVEALRYEEDEDFEDLCFIYSTDISANYLFDNLDSFLDVYPNIKNKVCSVSLLYKMTKDLEELADSKY